MKYDDLCEKITRLQKAKQSVGAELGLTLLKWEKEKRDSERNIQVLDRAKLLLEAYIKNGSMTVIYQNGQTCTQTPYSSSTNHPVTNFFNAKYLALDMASASVPYD